MDKAKAETSAAAGGDSSAYDNMKDLFALARQQGRLAADDTRGGWKGQGKLGWKAGGNWVSGKDLGEVSPERKAAADDDMPSSTSSWSDMSDTEVAQYKAPAKRSSASFFVAPAAAGGGGERKRRRDKDERKEKKKKKHKSEHKHKKSKQKHKEKDGHKERKRRRDSD